MNIIKPIKMYKQFFLSISVYTCSVFSVCFDMYVYVVVFSVNHRIVYLYVWFVSMCLCCIRPNNSYVMVYKVANWEVKIDAGNKLIPPDRLSRHTNAHSFQIPFCKTSIRKESFYRKTIRDWNNLPAPVTAAKSL